MLKLKEQVPPVMSQVQVVVFNEYGIAQAGRELHPHEQSEFWVIGAVQVVGHPQAQVVGLIVFPIVHKVAWHWQVKAPLPVGSEAQTFGETQWLAYVHA